MNLSRCCPHSENYLIIVQYRLNIGTIAYELERKRVSIIGSFLYGFFRQGSTVVVSCCITYLFTPFTVAAWNRFDIKQGPLSHRILCGIPKCMKYVSVHFITASADALWRGYPTIYLVWTFKQVHIYLTFR